MVVVVTWETRRHLGGGGRKATRHGAVLTWRREPKDLEHAGASYLRANSADIQP